MEQTETTRITEFLNDIQLTAPEQLAIVEAIRNLFRQQENQQLTEGIKYGGLVFFNDDQLISGIFPYKKHISVEFSNGTDFNDEHNSLEGKGKQRRHIKIYSMNDIEEKRLTFYIDQALNP
jgi:hypothetical protein